MNEIEKSVLKTIVYYDCLDYPLTFKELEFFLFQGAGNDSAGVSGGLSRLIQKDLIREKNGFYFLRGRQKLVELRREKNEIAEKKWLITLGAVQRLRAVPYLRAVFASGSLALGNTDKESDLDVLIAVKSGRIWTTRLLIVLLLSFLGVRRTRYEKIAPDKICLNHFITDRSLHIPRKSIYTAQLYARLVPILGEEKLIDKFCEANSWVGEYIPKFSIFNLQFSNKFKIQNSKFTNSAKKIAEKLLDTKFGDWLESILRECQLRRIKNYHLTHKPGGPSSRTSFTTGRGRVKADDESLEFHPDSPELKIIERYNKKMAELGFPELGEEKDSGLTRI